MDDKQELNDILISESEGKMANSKKILLLGGAGTLLFMIAIFVVYSLNQDDAQTDTTPAALPPKAMQQGTMAATKADEPLFEQVPIQQQNSAEQKFDKIVEEIQNKKAQQPAPVKKPTPAATTAPATPAIPKAPSQPAPVTPTVAAPVAPPATPAPAPLKQQTVSAQNGDAPKGTYVQVGAFSKFTPDEKFIQTIKQNNYTYYLHEVTSNGKKVNKVLIGPFKDRPEALKAIKTIREKIIKGAFITKVQ